MTTTPETSGAAGATDTAGSDTAGTGIAGSELIGVGHYQPSRVVTNDDLAKIVETNDEWIQQRTGIVTRHLAADDETVADMAIQAAQAALADAGITAAEVDLIVVASCTATDRSPSTAGRVSAALGAGRPAIFDINAACSGFAHALAIADQAIRAGAATTALVIGAEKLSDYTDWTDRTTCILVADAAGAFVIRRSDIRGVSDVTWGSEPELADAVRIVAPSLKFAQEGKSVFKWAISEAADIARATVQTAGYQLADIRALVAHQANRRIIEPLARQLGMENAIVATDISESGNTSAASIPMAFSKLWQAGELPADVPVLLYGFGGGFAYAGQVVRTPRRSRPSPTAVGAQSG
ncbi:3-oxoacyl-[acyl-carrier-protein] synthase-3 [Microlunatus panaciterrae]|uniref:Beta-ketoacyl-[acyl-carrier-protein] synthase III n=1 Tax=Microlunatus panaciterrae TaxID=400768 RepID=A0ABS2RJG5_9ACTN|nr:3-oxoacyl-[acyl-carrier-protein] synthase-3 [Microlunatus panaciterrae]